MEPSAFPKKDPVSRKTSLFKRELLCFLAAAVVFAVFFVLGLALLFWLPEDSVSPSFIGMRWYLRSFLDDPTFLAALKNTVVVPLLISVACALLLRAVVWILSVRFPRLPRGWLDLVAVSLSVVVPMVLFVWRVPPLFWTWLSFWSYQPPMPPTAVLVLAFTALPALLTAFLLWGVEQLSRCLYRCKRFYDYKTINF